ncbi:MAG: dehydrogenase, partial [Candidatus Dadabacteria bacterium]
MIKTKAAILETLNKPLIVDEIELPSLRWGQVLVKVKKSGICGAQLGEISGVKGEDPYLPHLLGHEAVGEVVEIGDEVKKVKAGDKVILHWREGRGLEAPLPNLLWRGNKLNCGRITTFSEYTIVSENRVTKIDSSSLDENVLAIMGCAVCTSFGIVTKQAKVRFGESVLVLGCGGIGLTAVIAAKAARAHPVVGVDLYDKKLALAKKVGADFVLNGKHNDLYSTLMGFTKGAGFDVVIETTGNVKVIELAYEIASPKGRVILAGVPHFKEKASFYTLPLHFGKVLIGSKGGDTNPDYDIPRYLKAIEKFNLPLSSIITHRGKLDEINSLISLMREGECGRCVVEFEGH